MGRRPLVTVRRRGVCEVARRPRSSARRAGGAQPGVPNPGDPAHERGWALKGPRIAGPSGTPSGCGPGCRYLVPVHGPRVPPGALRLRPFGPNPSRGRKAGGLTELAWMRYYATLAAAGRGGRRSASPLDGRGGEHTGRASVTRDGPPSFSGPLNGLLRPSRSRPPTEIREVRSSPVRQPHTRTVALSGVPQAGPVLRNSSRATPGGSARGAGCDPATRPLAHERGQPFPEHGPPTDWSLPPTPPPSILDPRETTNAPRSRGSGGRREWEDRSRGADQ